MDSINRDEAKQTFHNSLRLLLNIMGLVFIFLLLVHVGLITAVHYTIDVKKIALLKNLANDINIISDYAFEFVKPLLQLIIVLMILEWFVNRFGYSFQSEPLKLSWNTQTVVTFGIIIALSIGALLGIAGSKMLKDLALVAIGFYFGTQNKSTEVLKVNPKTEMSEENTDIQNSTPDKTIT